MNTTSGRRIARAAALVGLCAAAACGLTVLGTGDEGVVRFIDIEGGCWVIDVGEARPLEPTNLDQAFRQDGLVVEFEAIDRPDLVSVCQVGRIVELTAIRVAPGR